MFLAVLIFSGQTFSAYAQNISLTNLLQGWLENDREIKSAAIVLNKAELSNSSLKIENGFNMQFSTGSMRFTMNGGKSIFTINPEIKAELPSVRNLALTAESDITFSNETQISNTALKAEINILKPEILKNLFSPLLKIF